MNPGKEIVRKQIEAIHFGYVRQNKTKKISSCILCFRMFLIDRSNERMNEYTLTRFLPLFILQYIFLDCAFFSLRSSQ